MKKYKTSSCIVFSASAMPDPISPGEEYDLVNTSITTNSSNNIIVVWSWVKELKADQLPKYKCIWRQHSLACQNSSMNNSNYCSHHIKELDYCKD